jgi:hypothetical protein
MQLIESSTGPVWRKQTHADRERLRDACRVRQSTISRTNSKIPDATRRRADPIGPIDRNGLRTSGVLYTLHSDPKVPAAAEAVRCGGFE